MLTANQVMFVWRLNGNILSLNSLFQPRLCVIDRRAKGTPARTRAHTHTRTRTHTHNERSDKALPTFGTSFLHYETTTFSSHNIKLIKTFFCVFLPQHSLSLMRTATQSAVPKSHPLSRNLRCAASISHWHQTTTWEALNKMDKKRVGIPNALVHHTLCGDPWSILSCSPGCILFTLVCLPVVTVSLCP